MAASGEGGGLYDLKRRSRKKDILSTVIQYIVKTMAITRHDTAPPFAFHIFLFFSPLTSVQSSATGRRIKDVKAKKVLKKFRICQ